MEKEKITDKELVVSQTQIENRIFTIRGVQVMLDSDLAEMYQVSVKRLNEQVKRNTERFPPDFMFKLSELEWNSLRSQNATLESGQGQHRKYLPFVFTEQGVSGLSGVLKSETAARVHVAIMRAFVAMRKFVQNNQLVYSRLDNVERKQLEADQKFEQVFKALESKDTIPAQGIFFNGQIFDAYVFVNKIIKSAKISIVLIDNYIDEAVLEMFCEKSENVKVVLLTKKIEPKLKLSIEKFNEQYKNIEAKKFDICHDRFLIIDNKEIYHLGASLKDLGRKIFAFSKMETDGFALLEKIGDL